MREMTFSFYDTMDLPLSDHRLVRLGTSWSKVQSLPLPQTPPVKWWGAKQFAQFNKRMLSFCRSRQKSAAVEQATQLLHEVQRFTQCMHNIRHRRACNEHRPDSTKTNPPETEQLQNLVAKMRMSATMGTGFFYKLTKQWKEGLMKPARPEPSPVGVHDILSNFSGDPEWNLEGANTLINKHFAAEVWPQEFPTFKAFEHCLQTSKEKASGPD